MRTGNEQSEIDMDDEFDWGEFKVELNNLMLTRGPKDLTIGEAEEAMLELISVMNRCLLKARKESK